MTTIRRYRDGDDYRRISLCQFPHCENDAVGELKGFKTDFMNWAMLEGSYICESHGFSEDEVRIIWPKAEAKP